MRNGRGAGLQKGGGLDECEETEQMAERRVVCVRRGTEVAVSNN